MLKFFRSIRRKLLVEGSLPKYLIYAIGEILLVVIGILIALQINAWNTERINRIKESEYLNSISEELKRDIEYFTDEKNRFKNKEESLKRMIKSWQQDTFFVGDSLQYFKDFMSSTNAGPWYSEPVTWAQLVQTGDLQLIQNHQLKDALFSYYSLVKRISDNYSFHPMENLSKIRSLTSRPLKYIDPDDLGLFYEKPPNRYVFDWIWENRSDNIELFVDATIISKVQQRSIQRIIDEGVMVLELLESE